MKVPVRWLLPFAAVMFLALAAAAQETGQPTPRVIEMTATNYQFSPGVIHVKANETVELEVKAIDKAHGIKVDTLSAGAAKGSAAGLEITSPKNCVKFKKGQTGTIEFVALTPGTYKFVCCKLCGLGHDHMKGEIVVDP